VARLVGSVDLIATSPLARAVGTARILAEVLETQRVQTLDPLAPGGSERRIVEFLRRQKSLGRIVLVGHEPDLGRLAASLTVGTGTLPLRKAGACAILFDDDIAPGEGALAWFAPPSVLRRLGRRRTHA
jgi:phosphohistidine phosphatase